MSATPLLAKTPIWLERIYPRCRKGCRRKNPSLFFVTTTKDGKRKREYIPKEMHSVILSMQNSIDAAALAKKKKTLSPQERPGQPAIFPAEAKRMLETAGYSVRGRLISRCRKTFLTIEACRVRFEQLLSGELKEAVKTPMSLQKISIRAESILKRSCRKKQGLNFDTCFVQALIEHIQKNG